MGGLGDGVKSSGEELLDAEDGSPGWMAGSPVSPGTRDGSRGSRVPGRNFLGCWVMTGDAGNGFDVELPGPEFWGFGINGMAGW